MALGTDTPRVLLLGGGYTLQELATILEPHTFVITSRQSSLVQEFLQRGWLAAQVDTQEPTSVESVFERYPTLSTVVDSIPPIAGEDPTKGIALAAPVLSRFGVKRVVYLSTTGVFGVRDGSWVDENSVCNPWNSSGRARLESENLYRSLGFNLTALRLPAIYGPGRDTLTSLRSGRYRLVGDGNKWTNRIHVADLASALKQTITQTIVPSVLCIADDEPVVARDLVGHLCNRFLLPYPASASEEELVAKGQFSMLSNQRIANRLMKEALGIELCYPSVWTYFANVQSICEQ